MRSLQKHLPSGAAPTKGSRKKKWNKTEARTGRKAATAANGSPADNKPTRGRKKSLKPRNSKKGSK
jgi:hypothetical protein